MKIKTGKFYKNSHGNKVGPMRKGTGNYWDYNGSRGIFDKNGSPSHFCDPRIIEEWTEEETINIAELAAKHKIKITVSVGEYTATYDGTS